MISLLRCQTPELAAETVQPIRKIPDAAILFSDIVSASHGNRSIDETNFGPFANPIRTIQDVESNCS
jgi:uroporphyrinogen-III decarboxylase